MSEIILELEGLNCASCADKIETQTRQLEGVDSANLDFVTKKIKIKIKDEEKKSKIVDTAKQIIKSLEPDVKVTDMTEGTSYEHSHEHGDVHKEDLIKVIFAGILFAMGFILKLEGVPRLLVFLISYLIVGYDVIIRAVKNAVAREPFDENFLMTIATIGAFIIGEYPEGVAVMLFYQVGELFQDLAVNNSRRSIESLMDIRPDYANLVSGEEVITADPADIHIGNHILIRPGEKIPLDGVVIEGESTLDTSNITGESVPSKVSVGDEIFSGSVNHEGLLTVKVNKEFGDSTVSKILDLVENASSKKAPTENFITKFARYYTPVVVFIALGIGILPTLLFGEDLSEWAYRSFVFLVMSCPCALVISIPLGFFGGIGAASKEGVLIKGGNYLEALNDVEKIVFDKTGTITKGIFEVTDITSYGDYSKEEILELGAYGEAYSNHPIGRSIVDAYNNDIDKDYIKDYQEIAGKGIQVKIDGAQIILGNKRLLKDNNISITEEESIGTVVYIGKDNEHIGTIVVSDELKDGVIEHLQDLKKIGIKQTIMLSGDNEETTKKVGELASIDKVYGNLLPQDKVFKFEEILAEKNEREKIIFVGDGVNDAPVLARADIGVAMGALGSDAAIEASDMVIMTDEISKISTGMKIAKKTKRIVVQNIAIAIGVKLVVLGLGVLGKATMWQAVFADVGVSIIAILNAIRALRVEE